MAEREALTADYVRSILHYDPETGVFTWRERPREHFQTDHAWRSWNSRFAGNKAAGLDGRYFRIKIKGCRYQAHRLAWLYVTNDWPVEILDHIDGDQFNNSFNNLRAATYAQNAQNRRMPSNNTSGLKGAHWNRARMKWTSRICSNGKQINLGYFGSREEASAAYAKAARDLHGEFARTDSCPHGRQAHPRAAAPRIP